MVEDKMLGSTTCRLTQFTDHKDDYVLVLGGPSVEQKDNQTGQNSMGFMRKLFHQNVKNRTGITVKKVLSFFNVFT